MYPDADLDKFVVTDNNNDKIIGFGATSDISSETTAFVALLFKPGNTTAHVWTLYQTLVTKHLQGFQRANLGGCETEGTHNFMRRTFRPVEQLQRTHLVYTGQRQG